MQRPVPHVHRGRVREQPPSRTAQTARSVRRSGPGGPFMARKSHTLPPADFSPVPGESGRSPLAPTPGLGSSAPLFLVCWVGSVPFSSSWIIKMPNVISRSPLSFSVAEPDCLASVFPTEASLHRLRTPGPGFEYHRRCACQPACLGQPGRLHPAFSSGAGRPTSRHAPRLRSAARTGEVAPTPVSVRQPWCPLWKPVSGRGAAPTAHVVTRPCNVGGSRKVQKAPTWRA